MNLAWCFCLLLLSALSWVSLNTDFINGSTSKAPIAVWIDADPSIGIADIDDALAIIVAFSSGYIKVRGVSTVFGNADLDKCHDLAVWICSIFSNQAVPLHKGASSIAERGQETNATYALAAALSREPLMIIALGPLTNIASTIMLHAQQAINITSIVAVAGRRPGQRFKPNENSDHEFGDLNFESDPYSFEYLLNSALQVSLTLIPWEVSSKVWITPPDVVTIGNSNTKCVNDYFAYSIGSSVYIHRHYESSTSGMCASIALITEMIARWSAVWTLSYDAIGFNPFDCVVIAYIISPELFHCDRMEADIRILNSGALVLVVHDDMNENDFFLRSSKSILTRHSRSSVTYCHTSDFRSVRNLILQLLSTAFEYC
jgi:inosine-uridine nucleoside N-ribohydrolase